MKVIRFLFVMGFKNRTSSASLAQSKLRNPFTVVRAPLARCKTGSCNYGIYIITLPPNERKGYIFKCR